MNTHAQELGRLGGKAHNPTKSKETTLSKYGSDFYKNIAAKRRKRTVQVDYLALCRICGIKRRKHSGYSYDQYMNRSKEKHEFIPML